MHLAWLTDAIAAYVADRPAVGRRIALKAPALPLALADGKLVVSRSFSARVGFELA
jgi:hypothetical protein